MQSGELNIKTCRYAFEIEQNNDASFIKNMKKKCIVFNWDEMNEHTFYKKQSPECLILI